MRRCSRRDCSTRDRMPVQRHRLRFGRFDGIAAAVLLLHRNHVRTSTRQPRNVCRRSAPTMQRQRATRLCSLPCPQACPSWQGVSPGVSRQQGRPPATPHGWSPGASVHARPLPNFPATSATILTQLARESSIKDEQVRRRRLSVRQDVRRRRSAAQPFGDRACIVPDLSCSPVRMLLPDLP